MCVPTEAIWHAPVCIAPMPLSGTCCPSTVLPVTYDAESPNVLPPTAGNLHAQAFLVLRLPSLRGFADGQIIAENRHWNALFVPLLMYIDHKSQTCWYEGKQTVRIFFACCIMPVIANKWVCV